jgi:outer membrane protein OmpA-like peptidoglycan-associated protein
MIRVVRLLVGALFLVAPCALVGAWASSAASRLEDAQATASAVEAPQVAVASAADEQYCTPALKQILRRVLNSCGLLSTGGSRGCQPVEARNVATMSDEAFNALFIPMRERGGIVQFDRNSAELDEADRQLVESVFASRRGASYFLVVSRASPEGAVEHNRELSQGRAEAVLAYLQSTFHDPELERQVGLLWLGEEYAQLDPSFCAWRRSGAESACRPEELNRSAFIAWIDCQL